jgi:hypothetical protein
LILFSANSIDQRSFSMTNLAASPGGAQLVDQPSAMPTRKITFTALAGAIVTVAIFIVQTYLPEFRPSESVIAGLTTIVSVGVGWFVRERA